MRTFKRIAMAMLLVFAVACKDDETVDKVDTEKTEVPSLEPTPDETDQTDVPASDESKSGALPQGSDEQRILLDQAKTHYMNEDWDRAKRGFEKLVKTGKISAPQVTAYIALGELYREEGNTERALELYARLQNEAPDVPEAHFMSARAMAESGETTKAMRAYEKTLKLQPDYLQAYVELGGLLTRSGREDEAQKIFLKYERKIYEMARLLESSEAEPEEQVHVLEVFSFVQDDRANAAILKSLSNPNALVREKAVTLAEEFRLGAARDELEALADSDPELRVRLAAREAVQTLEDAPTDGAAPTFVKDPSGLPETDSAVNE